MQSTNFPATIGQWKRYFDETFDCIGQILPIVAFGQNKIDLIITNLQIFQTSFFKNHPPTISARDSRILFDFFKTCAALISFMGRYTSKNMLNFILTKPINAQFNELALLWSSWSRQSSSLMLEAFIDFNPLFYAHYLDIKTFYDTIFECTP